MLRHARHTAIAALALLTVALTATAASANDVLTIRPGGSFTATSSALTFTGTGPIRVTTTCSVTFSGRLLTQTANAYGADLGLITSATASGCTNGSAMRFLVGTGMPLLVDGTTDYSVTPTAAVLAVDPLLVSVTVLGSPCLYDGSLPLSLALRGTPHVTGQLALLPVDAPFTVSGGLCPTTIDVAGAFTLAPQQTLTPGPRYPMRPDPIQKNFGPNAGTQVVTFVNRDAEDDDVTVHSVAFDRGNLGFTIDANTCLDENEEQKTIVADDFCRVTVRFVRPANQKWKRDILWLKGDPGIVTKLGQFGVRGR